VNERPGSRTGAAAREPAPHPYAFRDHPGDRAFDRSDPENLFVRHIAIAEATLALLRKFGPRSQ